MKPLVIDLFCGLGLSQPKFCLGAYSSVQKFMACRAENPDHVRLSVLHLPPNSIPAVVWLVREFNNSAFTARLARSRQIGVFAAQSNNYARVLELAPAIIDLLNGWVLPVKGATLLFSCLLRASIRAIAAIAIGLDDCKMRSTNTAVSSAARDIGLFAPTKPSSARLTFKRTVTLIGAFRTELHTTGTTE